MDVAITNQFELEDTVKHIEDIHIYRLIDLYDLSINEDRYLLGSKHNDLIEF